MDILNSILSHQNLEYIIIPESSLIVPDFTISKYGSSCNSFFFGLILSSFLSLPLLGIPSCLGDVRKKTQWSGNEAKKRLHELPYLETVKPGTIRLVSDQWPLANSFGLNPFSWDCPFRLIPRSPAHCAFKSFFYSIFYRNMLSKLII